jgi:glucan phosphoethanolaminetransferase (alkaline phosphatase superfamily)
MRIPFYVYDIILISCFLTGCKLVRKNWSLEYKLLVVLSGITVLIEISEQEWYYVLQHHNDWIYNLFLPLECGCLLYVFYRASLHPVIKRLNAVLLMLLPVGAGILYSMYPYFWKCNDHVAFIWPYYL